MSYGWFELEFFWVCVFFLVGASCVFWFSFFVMSMSLNLTFASKAPS